MYVVKLADVASLAIPAKHLRLNGIKQGDTVLIHGVTARPNLNGLLAECGSYDVEKRRYTVKPRGLSEISLREETVHYVVS